MKCSQKNLQEIDDDKEEYNRDLYEIMLSRL